MPITVITMEVRASRSGSTQRRSRSPGLSLSPAVNSEISTITSVNRSSSQACCRTSALIRSMPQGLTARPTIRYSMAVESGRRASTVALKAMKISSKPTMTDQRANSIPYCWAGATRRV